MTSKRNDASIKGIKTMEANNFLIGILLLFFITNYSTGKNAFKTFKKVKTAVRYRFELLNPCIMRGLYCVIAYMNLHFLYYQEKENRNQHD